MGAFGIGIAWFGYAVSSWGYCMLRGYPVKFTDWINPLHPYAGAWPPPGTIPSDEVFPGVSVGSAGAAAEAPEQTAPKPGTAPKAGTPAPVTSGSGPVLET
jgi:hypothetical protein